MRHGAKAANYAKVEEFVYDDGRRVAGVKVRDLLKNRIVEVRERSPSTAPGRGRTSS